MIRFRKSIAVVLSVLMIFSVCSVASNAAGSGAPVIRGTLPNCDWDGTYDADNTMINDGGLFRMIYDTVTAGIYYFKVVENDKWYGINYIGKLYGYENVKVVVPQESSLVITFDATTKEIWFLVINASAEGSDAPVIRGTLPNCDWDGTYDADNTMTNDSVLFKITYATVAAGSYLFKVVENGNWYGTKGINNVEIVVSQESDLTITFNPATKGIGFSGAYVSAPTGLTVAPEETTVVSEPTTEVPEETIVVSEPTTEASEETTVVPEETTVVSEPTTEVPEETTVVPEPTTEASEETTVVPEETTVVSEPTTEVPEETTVVPEPTTEASEETTEAVEPTTTAPEVEPTTEAVEPTTTSPEVEPTTEAEPATTEAAETTTAPVSITKTIKFLPSKEQLEVGDTIKLVIEDKNGEIYTYDMSATALVRDGVNVYSAKISTDIIPVTVQFQFYKGENWVSQVEISADKFEAAIGKTITFNGGIYGETPEETTVAPTSAETEPAIEAPTTSPAATTKKANPIKVSVKTKSVKLKNLKKKAQTVKAIKIKSAKGKVSCKITKAAKIKKFLKINAKGVITFNKWKKAKKGTYKVKVSVTAKGNGDYNKKTVSKIVKIKVK